MSRIFLVRHGERTGDKNLLVGRSDGYPLTHYGKKQAAALVPWARAQTIAHIYSSPRERCLQTARAFGEPLCLPIEVSDALDEFDFGSWTGKSIASLEPENRWNRFNSARSQVSAPSGESMTSVQQRVVSALKKWGDLHPAADIVAVTHAEPIRAALLYFMGRSLDDWGEVEIGEASVSVVEVNGTKYQVTQINCPGSADLPARIPMDAGEARRC